MEGTSDQTIRPARAGDADAIAAIHAEGLATGHASFRRTPPTWDEWWADYCGTRGVNRVLERDGTVLGWAGVAGVSQREVYRGVGEVSVYLAATARGSGLGAALLSALVRASEEAGYWTLIAQCFPENAASIAIHHRAGFRTLGVRRALGRMDHGPLDGHWRDVVMLERRSRRVGVDGDGGPAASL